MESSILRTKYLVGDGLEKLFCKITELEVLIYLMEFFYLALLYWYKNLVVAWFYSWSCSSRAYVLFRLSGLINDKVYN